MNRDFLNIFEPNASGFSGRILIRIFAIPTRKYPSFLESQRDQNIQNPVQFINF
jgi:hypothetical protein